MRLTDYFHRKYWNPFSFVFESKGAPHARTLRTSWIQKFIDAWLIFSGSSYLNSNDKAYEKIDPKAKAGLLDYALLHLPALLLLLGIGCRRALRKLPIVPKVVFGFVPDKSLKSILRLRD